MKAQIIVLCSLALILLCSCSTSYAPNSTYYERVKARYEQHIVLENDEHAGSKIFRHTLADIFTLCLAEIWYSKVVETYDLYVVKADEARIRAAKEEELFKQSYIGKKRKQIIQDFGMPDYSEDDGEGGKIVTYENSARFANTDVRRSIWHLNTRISSEFFETKKRMWFALDKNNVIYAVGFRTKDATPEQVIRIIKNRP